MQLQVRQDALIAEVTEAKVGELGELVTMLSNSLQSNVGSIKFAC